MITLDDFTADFTEDPGYFDFARVGPIGTTVLEEQRALGELLARARFGSLNTLETADLRVREAIATLTGFSSDQVVFQPNTSSGLMHAMFGFTGGVAMSPAEYPSITFAAARAAEALHALKPIFIDADYGRVTPASLRDQLDAACGAVAVSLVDFRTGYLADLDGIRQVIGDRLLIVDAIQAFGVVDAPWQVADVVISGGQKWVRAGWGTGFMALSDRAAEQLGRGLDIDRRHTDDPCAVERRDVDRAGRLVAVVRRERTGRKVGRSTDVRSGRTAAVRTRRVERGSRSDGRTAGLTGTGRYPVPLAAASAGRGRR